MNPRNSQSPDALNYHSETDDTQAPDFGILTCSFAFALADWITEIVTLYIVTFELRIGPSTHLQKNFIFDACLETTWTVGAFFSVLVSQFILRPSKGSRKRVGLWPTALIFGVLYSMSRWAIWWLVRLNDSADFWVAMGLAIAAGVLLAAIRRRWI